jgi:hypothetical protein
MSDMRRREFITLFGGAAVASFMERLRRKISTSRKRLPTASIYGSRHRHWSRTERFFVVA